MVNSFLQKLSNWSLVASLALLSPLATPLPKAAWAQPPSQAPEKLTQFISELETAANEQNLQAVTEAYSRDFNTSEGLNAQALAQKLEKLWDTYSRVNYEVELENWEQAGDGFIAETVTHIRGVRQANGKDVLLEATLRSRQNINNEQITSQEMLSERSQVFMGENPPRVKVNAPDQVAVGEEFNFDVIVSEPLGNDILLGTALEQEVTASSYLNPQNLNLSILPAGGIYRTGKVSSGAGERWLSAIIVRDNGMTLVSQRLEVVAETSALSNF